MENQKVKFLKRKIENFENFYTGCSTGSHLEILESCKEHWKLPKNFL